MTDFGTGLRGLIGAGRSRLSLSAATRARDLDQPSAAELAAAEQEIDRRLAGWQRPTPGAGQPGDGRSPTAGNARPPGDRRRPTSPPAGPRRVTPTPADIPTRGAHEPVPSTESASTVGHAHLVPDAAPLDADAADLTDSDLTNTDLTGNQGGRHRDRRRGSQSRKGRRRGGHGSGNQGSGGSSPSAS